MNASSAPSTDTARRLVHAADIQAAQARISSVIAATPLQFCPRLSELTGARVFLKREDLQDVRSYKIRGAYNAMVQLTDEERAAGVVAASAGNHAQGVAYACRTSAEGPHLRPTRRQRSATASPTTGATQWDHRHWRQLRRAASAARADAQTTGARMIEPFDSFHHRRPGTVAARSWRLSGQGLTPDTSVPVGGGGLLAGVTSYLPTCRRARPSSPSSRWRRLPTAAMAADERRAAVGRPLRRRRCGEEAGELRTRSRPQSLAHPHGHRPGGRGVRGAAGPYQNEGIIAEPAGAVVAALGVNARPGEVIVCIVSGGNNDVPRYAEIMERSLVYRGLKHYFLVNFPQKPGQLRMFLNDIPGPDDDIALFSTSSATTARRVRRWSASSRQRRRSRRAGRPHGRVSAGLPPPDAGHPGIRLPDVVRAGGAP